MNKTDWDFTLANYDAVWLFVVQNRAIVAMSNVR